MDNRVSHPLGRIRQAVLFQPLLAIVVGIMLVLMIPTLVGCLLDDRLFNGVNVWFKPLKFEISLGIQFGTLLFFYPLIDTRFRSTLKLRTAVWALAASALFEIAYILFRAVRQEGSHFNTTTVTADLLYTLMGIGALTLVGVTAWIGCLVLRSNETAIDSGLRLSVGLGLLVGSILGGITGMYLSVQTSHWIGGVADDSLGIPVLGWSRIGGDIRVAHFLGLHAMQGIPLVGLMAYRLDWPRRPVIWTVSLVWTLLTTYLFLQALTGRAFY